jgi:RNA polymerase sigma-70 factor (ECF subfamily)
MARPLESSVAVPAPSRGGVPLDAGSAEMADRFAVARACAGHPEAFAEVVRRHASGLQSLCSRILHDGRLGEDLCQETFARAFSQLGTFRGDGSVRHWLYSIAANGCRDFLRAGSRSEWPVDLSGEELWTAQDPEREVGARQSMAALSAALAGLPPGCREAFVLFHLDGLSYEEMSALTGVGVSALKVRVHRARELLRQRLGEAIEVAGDAGP